MKYEILFDHFSRYHFVIQKSEHGIKFKYQIHLKKWKSPFPDKTVSFGNNPASEIRKPSEIHLFRRLQNACLASNVKIGKREKHDF